MSDESAKSITTVPSTPQIGLDPNLALESFFKDPDWVFKSAVGGVMNASSLVLLLLIREHPILIPICFSLWAINTGYVLRTMREKLNDPQGRLPGWADWQDLFVSGMSWLAVTTGFLILLVTFTATDLLIASALSAFKEYAYLFALWTSGSIILIITLSLLLNLVLAATMANFAQEERMNAAFAMIKVFRRIINRPGDFLAAWMLGIGIQWLAVLIPCATIIGVLFLPSTVFAAQLITASLIAQAWTSSNYRVQKATPDSDLPIEKIEKQ